MVLDWIVERKGMGGRVGLGGWMDGWGRWEVGWGEYGRIVGR